MAREHLEEQMNKNRLKPFCDAEYMNEYYDDIQICATEMISEEGWRKKGKKVAMNM